MPPPPLQISPEGVQQLATQGIAHILIDADAHRAAPGLPPHNADLRKIYYSTSISQRNARRLALEDRQAPAAPESVRAPSGAASLSQSLVGSPLEWIEIGLKFERDVTPARPRAVSPRELAEALKDDVDIQILDLRPAASQGVHTPFPRSLKAMPHEVDRGVAGLSKRRWVVLVDAGDRVAWPIAERLFSRGHLLTAVLEGGYPAWVNATDR